MTLAGGCGSGGGAGGTNCAGCGRPLPPKPPPPPPKAPEALARAAAAAAAPPPAALPTSMQGAQNQSKVLGGAERPRQAAWTAVAQPEQGTRTPAAPGGGGGGERSSDAAAAEGPPLVAEGDDIWWCRCEAAAAAAASAPPPPPVAAEEEESLDAPPQAAHTSACSLSALGVACTAAQKSFKLTPASASHIASAGLRSREPACSSKSEHEILPVAPLPPRGLGTAEAEAPVAAAAVAPPLAAARQALQWQSMSPSTVTSPVRRTGPARKAAAEEEKEEAFPPPAPRPRPPPLPAAAAAPRPLPPPPPPPRPKPEGEEGPLAVPAGLPRNSTFCPASAPDRKTCRSVGALPPGQAPASRALAAPSTSACRKSLPETFLCCASARMAEATGPAG